MMRQLFATCVLLVSCFVCCNSLRAELIVFTLEQVGGVVDIPLGSQAEFRILIHADVTPITNIDGIDFIVGADDDGTAIDSGSRTAGGRFSAASAPLGGFPVPPPTSYLAFTLSNFNQTLPITDVELATFTLDTSGATIGTYDLSLHDVLAINGLFGVIPTSIANPGGRLSYNIITPVPEPSLLAGLALALPALPRLLRRRPTQA